ncbi:hypothetical protein AWC38_SpisGene12689 [Stylophora pistillata]|uniref:Uncharacterized protein n=1 Tax=Stylophora pistillata TaxID=50429 RepID=A0A2B4S166_STYPI|nr:hypothetical protein AWC38_SpisGene12689 [Stylophora pistillata]
MGRGREFPQITENIERRKRASEQLRADPATGKARGERRAYIEFPRDSDHSTHFLGQVAEISQRIDPRIVEKIHALAGDGVRDVNEMRRHIHVFLQNSLYPGSAPPPKSNKRFCPSKTTIKNHVHIAVIKQHLAKIDQANLIEKIKFWRVENEVDFFEFRPYVHPAESNVADSPDGDELEDDLEELKVDDSTSNNGLLFVHQTHWQRQKTNIEYKVVASFVTQSETTDAIKEALSIIMKWNPDWAPKHFMVDYAEEEISAVEDLFPEHNLIIRPFTVNRYLENNVRFSSQYRQYNAEVPHYLHDRPSSLVNHCLDRLWSATKMEKECIQLTDEERGSFKVKSLDPNTQGRWYNLSFGDAETMPNSLTHIVDYTESLKEVYTLLRDCIHILSNAVQKEEGLVLKKPPATCTSTSKSGSASSFQEIPKAKTRQPFSDRHSRRAETMKRTYKVNVDITAGQHFPKRAKTSPSDCDIKCEIVSMDLDYKGNDMADHGTTNCEEMFLENTCTPNPVPPAIGPSDEEVLGKESTIPPKPDVKSGVQTSPKSQDQPCTANSDAKFIVVDETSPDPDVWVDIPDSNGKLTLYPGNKENILRPDGWLIDKEVTAAQLLLKEQFPCVNGLEDTSIIGPLVSPTLHEFVQVVNTGNHWVCLSTVGCTSWSCQCVRQSWYSSQASCN